MVNSTYRFLGLSLLLAAALACTSTPEIRWQGGGRSDPDVRAAQDAIQALFQGSPAAESLIDWDVFEIEEYMDFGKMLSAVHVEDLRTDLRKWLIEAIAEALPPEFAEALQLLDRWRIHSRADGSAMVAAEFGSETVLLLTVGTGEAGRRLTRIKILPS